MSSGVAWSLLLAVAALDVPLPPSESDTSNDVVVTARRIPHCYRRPGDPADAVLVPTVRTDQRVIAPDKKTDKLSWQIDREQMSGSASWQRAGTGIGEYIFRVPEDGAPMCIGAAVRAPGGWGQLRQIIPIEKGNTGKYLHFSAFVAAREAGLIRFWLVSAASKGLRLQGGDTGSEDLKGTFGWKRIDLVAGPIPFEADHASYGFLLWGKGDVWLYKAKMEIQTRDQVKDIPGVPLTARRHIWEIK